jgi:hypothetical protein
MEGILTAVVAFIFVCIVYPRLVRVRAQFYVAIAAVVVILFFHSLATMVGNARFYTFVAALNGLVLLIAFVMLILATGGLSLHELTGDIKNAFEVVRRGETEKEVIIPRGGQGAQGGSARETAEEPRRQQPYTINSPEPSAAATAPPPEPPHAPFPPPTPSDQPQGNPANKGPDRSSLPLD